MFSSRVVNLTKSGWYGRFFLSSNHFGLAVDVEWYSKDDFEIAVDIGPVTLAIGRDVVAFSA